LNTERQGSGDMATIRAGEAFSAGIGLALGLAMTQYMFQAMRPPERLVKQVIVCLKCGSKNPTENKFCGQCGQAFYLGPPIKCPKCKAMMPGNMKFCGNCGRSLKKQRKKKRELDKSLDANPKQKVFLRSCRRTLFPKGSLCCILDN